MDKERVTKRYGLKAAGILLLVALVALVATGCSQPEGAAEAQSTAPEAAAPTESEGSETSAEPYVFTDDLGNEVTVSSPERVVACMGSFAHTWQLAGGTLIGATEDALAEYGISDTEISTVGQFTSPNLEEIIALSPDFVIMTGASSGRNGAASQTDLRESLVSSGIQVAYFNVTTFDDYLRMLKTFCDINGRDDLYQENGTAVQERIAAIVEDAQAVEGEAPSVLLMTTHSGGTRVQDSSTQTGAMLADLGAVNLADENTSILREFSLEAIIEMNPDYILVVPMGNDDEAAMKNLEEATAANPAWSTLDAVQNDRFVTLDKTKFLYKPNNKWDESYQILSDILFA